MAKQETDVAFLLRAVSFAAHKHRDQQRKDNRTPYVNHPVAVAEILAQVAGVTDREVLAAAILHDTIEDTETTVQELATEFGDRVTELVLECTDDKSLPKPERKRLQVEHAPDKSEDAKLIKIADKISNLLDMVALPPTDWTHKRKLDYIAWSNDVFQGLKGGSAELDKLFEVTLQKTSEQMMQHS